MNNSQAVFMIPGVLGAFIFATAFGVIPTSCFLVFAMMFSIVWGINTIRQGPPSVKVDTESGLEGHFLTSDEYIFQQTGKTPRPVGPSAAQLAQQARSVLAAQVRKDIDQMESNDDNI